jgi:pimeloyl-ACP methyl ester carboxylesterase
LRAVEEKSFARIEHWTLTLNAVEPVPALLVLPTDQPPRGLVIYCHAHGNRFECGKDELLLGRPALASPPYAEVLPALGYAVLAIDHWCFGERAANSERAMVKRLLWDGCTLWGYRVHDTLAALEWLRARSGFATLPVATLGLSMGSTMAVWAAALEPGIDACIDLCCLAEYDSLMTNGSFDLHGEYFFVPDVRREFSAAEISALIAPRLHVSLVGEYDPLTPPEGVATIDRAMRSTYDAMGHPANWMQHLDACGHQESAAMRLLVTEYLQKTIAR